MANWQISNIWNWYCCCHFPGFFGPQKFFHQVFYQFYYFNYKLHRIIMTYYIIDKKANNFDRTSSFAVTIAVATCDSFYIYALSTFASFVLCLLCLHLLYFDELSTPSASFVTCFVCVCCALVSCLLICVFRGLLCLRLLSMPCPLRHIYYALVSCLLVYIFCDLLCLRLLCLNELFTYLCFLWLTLFASAIYAWSALSASAVF